MKIQVSTPSFGKYFRYCVEFQGLFLWHSQNFYRRRQEALNAAFSDVWSVLLEFNFFSPSGLFDLKSGVVLATNYAHQLWFGRSSVGCHYSQVLCDFKVNSRIVPAGTRALGLYQINTQAPNTRSQLIAFIQENEAKALEDPAIAKQVKAAKRKLRISIDEEQ